jgi:autophagy-related protein 13
MLSTKEQNEPLPSVYKKGVVAFRSLYSFLRMLPSWKLYRQLGRQLGNSHSLRMKFRIRQAHELSYHQDDDPLTTPLFTAQTQQHGLRAARPRETDLLPRTHETAHLSTPAGACSVRVDYRDLVGFSCASGESVISAALLSSDERSFTAYSGRSLPGNRPEQRHDRYSSTAVPTTTRERPRGLLGAYGSLGTVHTSQRRGSSFTQQAPDSDEDEEYDDDMKRMKALREEEGISAFPPAGTPPIRAGTSPIMPPGYFKNGPLVPNPSPRTRDPALSHSTPLATSPRPTPSPRPSPFPIHPPSPQYASGSASSSKRTSLNTLPQQQLRNPSLSNEGAIASSGSSSPKPAPVRYSSSFANRPRRWTSQSGKTGESNTSSGRGSSDSKEKLSHGSAKTDDDDIASFISDLERSKDTKFAATPSSPSRGNVVNLAKYSQMRGDSSALAEEMSSSSLLNTTPPSRRLSNVPGLSVSSSSSPSRVQPHAPHVRSRLSTQSIAEEAANVVAAAASSVGRSGAVEEEEEDELPFLFQHDDV